MLAEADERRRAVPRREFTSLWGQRSGVSRKRGDTCSAMSYMGIRFDVEAEDADAWSDALLALGAFAVEACDPRAETAAEIPIYAEPGDHRDSLWPITRLTALFDAGNDLDATLSRAAARVGRSPPPHEAFPVSDRDWVQATRMQFEPIRIAEGFWIVPSWCTPPDPNAIVVNAPLPHLVARAADAERGGANERRRAVPRRELRPLWGQRSGVSRKRGGTIFCPGLWLRLGDIVDCRSEAWRTTRGRHRHRSASACREH